MQIYVNNQLAALKKGTSFEYVSENRLFSGSDGYTLTITFPLKDCEENIAIFGHINRADVAARKVIFDCEIRDKGFYKFGSITITEISNTEVKAQFLEGRSEQNFDTTFDEIYINDLDLGQPSNTSCSQVTPSDAWSPLIQGYESVALPWVNDASGNIQNCPKYFPELYDNQGHRTQIPHYEWNTDECRGLSWQPYLLYITKKICEAVGYSYDFSAWEAKEEYRYLLICNCLPFAWYTPQYARALPHWSVEEYFEKLELFMGCEFTIDHRAKLISFAFTEAALRDVKDVQITDVISEHSVEISVEDAKCDYLQAKNLVYKECDHEMWKYYSCNWLIKSLSAYNIVRYDTLSQLLAANKPSSYTGEHRGSNVGKVLYAADYDAYFIFYATGKTLVHDNGKDFPSSYKYNYILRRINEFGGRIVDDSDDADEEEIEFVPAWIDETDDTYGPCLFLSFSGYDESEGSSSSFRHGSIGSSEWRQWVQEQNAAICQPTIARWLESGEKEKKAEYYSMIFVGWWDGAGDSDGKCPHPRVSQIKLRSDNSFMLNHCDLTIQRMHRLDARNIHMIDTQRKVTFKFLADNIPNPRALFFINGKRYLCEKITATFTENGMLQLLKGIFWPVIED